MRKLYALLLLVSLLFNVYVLTLFSDSSVGQVHKVVVKEAKDGSQTKVSENTSMFVVDFIGRINRCDTFLWAVSENRKEVKYTIWFAKDGEE